MSGLEILGALAGAAQVGVYIVKVAAFLSDVSESLEQAPVRIQQHSRHVQQLISIILHIKDKEFLHTKILIEPLESISIQASSLQNLLRELLSRYTHSSFRRRYWTALKGSKEKEVLRALQYLERDKSTLIFCLATSQTETIHNASHWSSMDRFNSPTKAPGLSPVDAPTIQANTALVRAPLASEMEDTNVLVRRHKVQDPEVEGIEDGGTRYRDGPSVERRPAGDKNAKHELIVEEPSSHDKSRQVNGAITLGAAPREGHLTKINKPQSKDTSFQVNGLMLGPGISMADAIGCIN